MKLKKILAAMAASALVVSMFGMAAFAEGDDVVEDVIDDEEVTDEVIDEDIDEDIADEDVEVEPEVEVEAENADTGNTPIALAVIPVALAAAAIVAKKAK